MEFPELILSRLELHRNGISEQWHNPQGTTTRHFIVDNFFPDELAWDICSAFPKGGAGFIDKESFRERKKTSAHMSEVAPILSDVTYSFQDPRVVAKVAEIVGLEKINPDPTLYAGGLSMMFKGDFLNPHIDNSHNADRTEYRRLNLLYYLTPDWSLENGGNFELWDEKRSKPKTIVSGFNKLVVMETNKTSWHSVSPVVAEGPRCCISNYYFSEVSPDGSEYFHVTSFDGRPEERMKKALAPLDNAARNTVSRVLKVGRGKSEVNKI
jgi:hypothetical protein